MKYTRTDLINTIKDASTSCDGYWWHGGVRIPFFDFSTYQGSPIEYSNHIVMLDKLQPFGVEPAAISCNGGPIFTMTLSYIDISQLHEFPDDVIQILLHYLGSCEGNCTICETDGQYYDYPIIDDKHYENETVAYFEKRAFNGSDLTDYFNSWDDAGHAVYNYASEFGLDDCFDAQFPLSAEENYNTIQSFENYMQFKNEVVRIIPEAATVKDFFSIAKFIASKTTNDIDWLNIIQVLDESDTLWDDIQSLVNNTVTKQLFGD